MEYLRTKAGCYAAGENLLGQFLYPIDDPEATMDCPADHELFELNPSLPQIPMQLWGAMVDLFIHMAKNHSNPQDVQVSVLYKLDAQEGEMPWRIAVPRQIVSAGSVNSPDLQDCCDLITGIPLTQYPPEGFVDAGSAHSHNTMSISISGHDDTTERRSQGIHFFIRSIKFSKSENPTYVPEARISYRQHFYPLTFEQIKQVVDLTPTDDTFDPKVLSYITLERNLIAKSTSTAAKESKPSSTKETKTSSVDINSMGIWDPEDYYLSGYGQNTIEEELIYLIEDMSTILRYSQSDIEDIIQRHFKGWVRGSKSNKTENEWDSSEQLEGQLLELRSFQDHSEEIQAELNSLISNQFDLGHTPEAIQQALTQFLKDPDGVEWNTQNYQVEDIILQLEEAYRNWDTKEDQKLFISAVEVLLAEFRASEIF